MTGLPPSLRRKGIGIPPCFSWPTFVVKTQVILKGGICNEKVPDICDAVLNPCLVPASGLSGCNEQRGYAEQAQ